MGVKKKVGTLVSSLAVTCATVGAVGAGVTMASVELEQWSTCGLSPANDSAAALQMTE